LRAYFADKLPSKEVAKRFGYTDGSFLVLAHQFRQNPQREFYLFSVKGPQVAPKKDKVWFDAMKSINIDRGISFDLDFHSIPFHGEDALVEKHYISKRSRKQKGILVFLAQDAKTRVFCYANADLRKDEQNDEILQFVEFWKQRTGNYPQELILDSKLTTYANLNKLNQKGILFMTLRRRSQKMLQLINDEPVSAWRRIELESVSRIYRTPRILDQKIALKDYQEEIRQLVVKDLGHEEPMFLLTNHLKCSAAKLINRYAKRMIIENRIEDSIDFFHKDALSSSVAMKVNLDVQLSLMASSLYRLLALKIANGYEDAKSSHLFRDFIDATGNVRITKKQITVEFQKRAHNPLLIAAGLNNIETRIPWLDDKKLHIVLG